MQLLQLFLIFCFILVNFGITLVKCSSARLVQVVSTFLTFDTNSFQSLFGNLCNLDGLVHDLEVERFTALGRYFVVLSHLRCKFVSEGSSRVSWSKYHEKEKLKLCFPHLKVFFCFLHYRISIAPFRSYLTGTIVSADHKAPDTSCHCIAFPCRWHFNYYNNPIFLLAITDRR